jgi:hypothetical protein
MANGSLYGKYVSAGRAGGQYSGSWYTQQGIEAEKGAESMLHEQKQAKLDETVGAIGEGITLASNIYEGVKSKKEMKKAAESLGAVEQKQGALDWLFGAEKEYKIGGDTFKASQVKTQYELGQSETLKGISKSMFDEASAPKSNATLTVEDNLPEDLKPLASNNVQVDEDITAKKLQTELRAHDDTVLGKTAAKIGVGGESKQFGVTSEKGTGTVEESLKGLVESNKQAGFIGPMPPPSLNQANQSGVNLLQASGAEPDEYTKKMEKFKERNWDPSEEDWYDPKRESDFGWTGSGWD